MGQNCVDRELLDHYTALKEQAAQIYAQWVALEEQAFTLLGQADEATWNAMVDFRDAQTAEQTKPTVTPVLEPEPATGNPDVPDEEPQPNPYGDSVDAALHLEVFGDTPEGHAAWNARLDVGSEWNVRTSPGGTAVFTWKE